MISGAGIGNWGNETYNLQDDYVEKDPNGRYVRVISFYFVYVFFYITCQGKCFTRKIFVYNLVGVGMWGGMDGG